MGDVVFVRPVVGAGLLMELDLDCDFAESSAFFLPKPNKLRFFFFSSPSVVVRGVTLPVPGSDSGSANVGTAALP
jgi:hypothetical protein